MSRLRIRIELNRGGVGVPLHKLASVVEEAQKFFHLLTEDVQIDQSKGEWLGFDFGNESLNFTAEFVGPVTVEQVAAFRAAFDGTTSLRRATISQFARITDAIEQDELAKEVVRIARIRRDAGEGTVLEIIDAETQWVTAQNNLINSMYDYFGAFADLQRAVGADQIEDALKRYEMETKGK